MTPSHGISTGLANRLWARLRLGQVAGHHFSRHHPIGRYIADFYCAQVGIVVLIESARAAENGRDARADQFELDGHRVVRVSEYELIDDMDAAVRKIADAVRVAPLDRVTLRPAHSVSLK
jgi:very-short-patch-repair endonuclease